MPSMMASCCSEPSRPRMAAGAISAMYAGAITDAMPMPMPAMTRHRTRSQTPIARPDRIEETKNRTAPSEHDARAARTVGELAAEPRAERAAEQGDGDDEPGDASDSMSNSPWMASTAPLMTELSKPNRNPPTAAATARPIALFLYGFGWAPAASAGGVDACDMVLTSLSPGGAPGHHPHLGPRCGSVAHVVGRGRRAVDGARRAGRARDSGARSCDGRDIRRTAPPPARDARPRGRRRAARRVRPRAAQRGRAHDRGRAGAPGPRERRSRGRGAAGVPRGDRGPRRRRRPSGPTARPTRCPGRSGGCTCCASGCAATPRPSPTGTGSASRRRRCTTSSPASRTRPGPADVRAVADAVLSGVYTGDLAVALERAAAFCQVLATGAAFDADHLDERRPDAARSG